MFFYGFGGAQWAVTYGGIEVRYRRLQKKFPPGGGGTPAKGPGAQGPRPKKYRNKEKLKN